MWRTAYPIFVPAIFSVPAHITLLLGLVVNSHLEQIYLELFGQELFMMTNDCGVTIKIEVLWLSSLACAVFDHWLIVQHVCSCHISDVELCDFHRHSWLSFHI